MSHPHLILLSLTLSIGAGLIAGVFFAFSNFVMKALGQLRRGCGVRSLRGARAHALNLGTWIP
jgi:uncharacterized membrane protein